MSTRRETGAVTLLAVAMIGILVLIGAALGVMGAMIHAHRQAQAAADLAALAAATTLADGGAPCASAAHIAQANHSRLDTCAIDGREVIVEVTVNGPRWLGQTADLRARARAGPG